MSIGGTRAYSLATTDSVGRERSCEIERLHVDDGADGARDRQMVRNSFHTRFAAVEGFTLIEVVVAMFLLGIVAMGLIPALVGSLKVSGQNTNIATASQLVGQQIDIARSGPATCAALTNYKNAVLPPVVDARGASYQPVRNSVTCTAGAPGIAKVSVSVTLTGNSHVLASAITYVYITS